MNRQIMKLLADTGLPFDVDWQDVIVSLAPSPTGDTYSDDDDWHGGFNLVVLDDGIPAYYCKFRPTGDSGLARETRVRQHLRRGTPGTLSVPDVRTASSETIDVQVTPFIRGSHYGRIVTKQSSDEFLQTVGSVLAGAGRLSDVAEETGLGGDSGLMSIGLADAAAEHLDYIAPLMDLSTKARDALAAVLAGAGDVPCRPQHGDLWWRNLLVDEDRVWVIDLEDYGTLQVPLYDDFTLLTSTIALRSDGSTGDMECLFGDTAESRGCRDLVAARAVSEGLNRRQLDGVLAYHVVHRASVVHRRAGVPYADPHLANVRFVADSIAAGRTLFSLDNQSPPGEGS